jgi:hypothetical protein
VLRPLYPLRKTHPIIFGEEESYLEKYKDRIEKKIIPWELEETMNYDIQSITEISLTLLDRKG